jgi:hypothetical protein
LRCCSHINPFLLQIACQRYDSQARFKKWDAVFITIGGYHIGYGSTKDKALTRAFGQIDSEDDCNKTIGLGFCIPRTVAEHDGRKHVIAIAKTPHAAFLAGQSSSPLYEQFFSFEDTSARDAFMQRLQVAAEANVSAAAKAAGEIQAVHGSESRLPPASKEDPSSIYVPPGFVHNFSGATGLAADVASLKLIIGDAAALAAHAIYTQEQLDDMKTIQAPSPSLRQFYYAICQGLQSMLHVATAFKSGSVMLDKNNSFSSKLHHVSDVVDAVSNCATEIRDFSTHAGSFEDAANTVAKILDSVATLADGIPIASFVVKALSSVVNAAQGLKFDARINRMIKNLFPDLSPIKWTFVTEEIARRVTVVFASDIEAMYSGIEDNRGRIKNWFRHKCSDYGLATLTSKAEDAVVMIALQKVEEVSRLALSESIPLGFSEKQLATFIVSKLTPSSSSLSSAASVSTPHPTESFGRSSPPPHVALNDPASQNEVEQLRKELEEQKVREQKREEELTALRKQVQQMIPRDKGIDAFGSGGGLVLASRMSAVTEKTLNAAATQAMRPVQRQIIRVEQQVQELTAFIISHSDPVLKAHLEDLTDAAAPVMKRDGLLGWQDRYLAVRNGTLIYGNTFKAVKILTKIIADSHVLPQLDHHVINLKGCSVTKCPEATDRTHFAFELATPEVKTGALVSDALV